MVQQIHNYEDLEEVLKKESSTTIGSNMKRCLISPAMNIASVGAGIITAVSYDFTPEYFSFVEAGLDVFFGAIGGILGSSGLLLQIETAQNKVKEAKEAKELLETFGYETLQHNYETHPHKDFAFSVLNELNPDRYEIDKRGRGLTDFVKTGILLSKHQKPNYETDVLSWYRLKMKSRVNN